MPGWDRARWRGSFDFVAPAQAGAAGFGAGPSPNYTAAPACAGATVRGFAHWRPCYQPHFGGRMV
ncbi:hypothetical protein EWE75_20995 [Sphingomonas populi]|uniref:Uncharacterized protein n=1 Tax=Sphingomonas populi TaxID=2484750 RepID=A0A4V2DCA8_9SPHN|nr:hypothetical protein EWE75_20995 [Sphingomonas populi]